MNKKAKKSSKHKGQPSGRAPIKPDYTIVDDSKTKWLVWISWAFCLLAGTLLSFKQLREPDLWWIMRTGEWIFENGHPPFKDWFSYTMYGEPWINVKWGFEALAYGIEQIGGAEFVFVLQAVVALSIMLLVYKIYQIFKDQFFEEGTAYPRLGLVIAVYVGLLAIEYRMNGRPEMVSHFLVVLYAFFLLKYRKKPGLFIFWLVPLQIFWTNFHEAYGTGVIMLGVFTAGSWLDARFWPRWIRGYHAKPTPWYLTGTTLLAILAMAVNPRGLEMILHPWNIYNQLGANQFTTELFAFTHPNYWQYQGYLNMGFLGLTFAGLFFRLKGFSSPPTWYLRPLINLGTGYLLFLGMFFYLSLTAYRNIPFFVLMSLPWAAMVLDKIIEGLKYRAFFYKIHPQWSTRMGYGLMIVAGIGIYGAIASGGYYEAFHRNEKFGLQVDATKNPVDAANFIEEKGLEGRCFSDYLTSSYLMWRFRPDFHTFIDLRDLDVFPTEFFNRFAQMVHFPKVFRQAETLYGFDYVVLYRKEFQQLHQHLFQSKDYEAVYADPVASVYVKEDSVSRQLIRENGFQSGERDIFQPNEKIAPSWQANLVNKLFWPFYEPTSYQAVSFNAVASQFYQSVNALDLAQKKAKKAVEHKNNPFRGHVAMGNLMLKYANTSSDQKAVNQYYSNAYNQFQKAYQMNPDNQSVLNSLGMLEMKYGNLEKAENYLKEAVDLDPLNANGYHYLSRLYQRKAGQSRHNRNQYLQQRATYLEKAYQVDKDNFTVELELGVAYCKLNKCQKAKDLLKSFQGSQKNQLLDPQNEKVVKRCLRKCR